ncbi:hypothetical protein D9613_004567 [Agrocybe pediades]|uniref:MARVEL domain-containing protein n=1 Tax=Agrocybe pediades TaxID=84607 RepID=A0A8H4QJY3_9AGAR|nr:hypothetical protein D9613_004567 [Agrocybe pediades]
MSFGSVVRRGHPILFSLLILFSIIEMCIAAWLTAKYNSNHNFNTSGERARVRYILFASIWTILFGFSYLILFLVAAGSALASIASHFVFLAITWVVWLAAAAAITQTLGGALNCKTNIVFVYCGQLNALEGFAWLIWVWVTIMLIVVLVRGITSAKQGDGYRGSLADE